MTERIWIRYICAKCQRVFWRFDDTLGICVLCRIAAQRKAKGLPEFEDI